MTNFQMNNSFFCIGCLFSKKNDTESAIKCFKKAIEYNPEQYILNYLIAVDYDVLAQYKNALMFYKKFVAQYKTDDE